MESKIAELIKADKRVIARAQEWEKKEDLVKGYKVAFLQKERVQVI